MEDDDVVDGSVTILEWIARDVVRLHERVLVVVPRGLGTVELCARVIRQLQQSEVDHEVGTNLNKKKNVQDLILVLNFRRICVPMLMHSLALCEQGENSNMGALPRVVHAEYSRKERESVYAGGGVAIVTSRVLLADALRGQLPFERIRAAIVCDAHSAGTHEHNTDAFALRLLLNGCNTRNSVRIPLQIIAISDRAEQLTQGFHGTQKTLKALQLRSISVWPRFHEKIIHHINSRSAQLIELGVALSPRAQQLQKALVSTIQACIRELQLSSRHSVDASEFLESGVEGERRLLAFRFDDILKRQLNPIWVKTGLKTRQLISDLQTLRTLLQLLPRASSVQFWVRLQFLRATEGVQAVWLMTRPADKVFALAQRRCFTPIATNSKGLKGHSRADPELSPKWILLKEILDEIQTEIHSDSSTNVEDEPAHVNKKRRTLSRDIHRTLIITRDSATAAQLRNVLCSSNLESCPRWLVEELHNAVLRWKPRLKIEWDLSSDGVRNGNQAKEKVGNSVQLIQEQVVIRTADDVENTGWIDLFEPSFVILYDVELASVRQLEMFRARRPGRALRVYAMMYEQSSEQTRYANAVERERDAFERIIQEKASMVLPEEEDSENQSMMIAQDANTRARGSSSLLGSEFRLNSTQSLGDSRLSVQIQQQRKLAQQSSIIVDVRELRAALPSVLHSIGVQLIPTTLTVGDYILSPSFAVERKSLPDLTQSLSSGRLFMQVETMLQYYKKVGVLIELGSFGATTQLGGSAVNENAQRVNGNGNQKGEAQVKPRSGGGTFEDFEDTGAAGESGRLLSVAGNADMHSELSTTSTLSKLVLLTLTFPKVRLLWSRGPHHAAQLLLALKSSEQEEPEESAAVRIGADKDGDDDELDAEDDEFHSNSAMNVFRSLPGITTTIAKRAASKISTLAELSTKSIDQLTDILGSKPVASNLFKFLHAEAPPILEE